MIKHSFFFVIFEQIRESVMDWFRQQTRYANKKFLVVVVYLNLDTVEKLLLIILITPVYPINSAIFFSENDDSKSCTEQISPKI